MLQHVDVVEYGGIYRREVMHSMIDIGGASRAEFSMCFSDMKNRSTKHWKTYLLTSHPHLYSISIEKIFSIVVSV